nr:nuclear transport factor 2 family protein [Mucilaginibacter sp. L294]
MENKVSIMPRETSVKYFTALSERDLEKVIVLFADELDWFIPGNKTIAPWLGQRKTRSEVEDFFRLLWQKTEAISGVINHMATDDNVVIISGSFKTRMLDTGKIFDSLFFAEITVVDGLIVKYRLLEDSFGLVQALI